MSEYFQLLSHMLTAAHAFDHHGSVKAATKAAGASDGFIGQASTLAHHGEALMESFEASGTVDRISDHAIHVAAQEVEMWVQTVKMLAKKNLTNSDLIDALVGKGIHGHSHANSVGAIAVNALSMLAAHPEIKDMAADRVMRDTINRGYALFKKLCKAFEVKLVARGAQDASEMDAHQIAMAKWLSELGGYIQTEESAAAVGYVPEGLGRPIGGNAFGVTLHERGQGTPPNPADAKKCTQWSIGRQGRNNENLGSGFNPPTVE